jgi:hypothetical protein
MKPRELFVLFGVLAVLAAALVALSGLGSTPAAAAGPPAAAGPDAPPGEPREPAPAAPAPAAVGAADATGAPPASADSRLAPEDAPGPQTSGSIDGRISLAANAAPLVRHYTIAIAELVNPNVPAERAPIRLQRSFDVGRFATPHFTIDDVPFSRFGYRVEVLAAGLNGSSQIVNLDEQHARAEVALALTTGTTFTLLLRDQHLNPRGNLTVQLVPAGDPLGREPRQGQSDAFGAVVLENIVQGSYGVWHEGQQVGEVQIQPATYISAVKPISVQSATLTLPVGTELAIEVVGPAGYGIRDAELELYQVDTTKVRRYQAATDLGGNHKFQHLEPGTYQIDVTAEGFHRTGRKVVVPANGTPAPVRVRLAPR